MKKYIAVISCLLFLTIYGYAFSDNSSSSTDNQGNAANLNSLQQSMASDPDIMNMILYLQNDPDFLNALNDPELMKQVKENDIEALKNNPAFLKLLDNQTVKEIEEKVKGQKDRP